MENNLNGYSVRDIQNKMLEVLLYFQSFCEEHDLKFVLAGGTCLGAVRHQGFIPWDDDVDVFMLRDDYEKLLPLWNQYADNEHYSCVRSDDKVNIHHSATEIRDNNTTFIINHSKETDMNHGVVVDVIPVDYVSENKYCLLKQYYNAAMFCCFNFQRLPEHKGRSTYYATKIALSLVRSFERRYKVWKRAEKRFIKYGKTNNGMVASLVEGTTIMRQHFPKEWITDPSYLTFEGHKMPVPKDYDNWLRMSYGDYMTLPPEEDRILRHQIIFVDLKHSYKDYKGIYYCKGESKDEF